MLELPAELARHTGHLLACERAGYGDNFIVWLVTSERGRFVVKIGERPEQIDELDRESRLLARLSIYAPFVASPLARVQVDGAGWFLFSCLEGEPLAAVVAAAETTRAKAELVAEFGRTLRAVHAWRPSLEYPANWLRDAVMAAEANVAAGRVAEPIDDPVFRPGAAAAELLAELRAGLPTMQDELVFCHGDWCLPNSIVRNGRIIGAVDWSRGGYADRRWDLVTGAWTLRYNLDDPRYVTTFLDAYGFRRPLSNLRWFEALYVLSV